jgi:hypothetical protein
MMFSDLLDVLSCSNLTCPNAALWYDLSENWAAHLGLGAVLGWLLPSRWAWVAFAACVLKEAALDIPNDPHLFVMTDSLLDLATIALGLGAVSRAGPDGPLFPDWGKGPAPCRGQSLKATIAPQPCADRGQKPFLITESRSGEVSFGAPWQINPLTRL